MHTISIPNAEARALHAVLEEGAPELAATFHSSICWHPGAEVNFKCSPGLLSLIQTALAECQIRMANAISFDGLNFEELVKRVEHWSQLCSGSLNAAHAGGHPTPEVEKLPIP